MSIFFLKSVLSVVLSLSAIIAMYTMFEIFGRSDKMVDTVKLKKIHRTNGILYLIVFAVVSYLCLDFIVMTKTELSARSSFHGVFALSILILMAVKTSYIRVYRHFYNQAKTFGLIMAVLTFIITGISGGYYLLVSEFGTDVSFDKIMQYKKKLAQNRSPNKDETGGYLIKSDAESIGKGKLIFETKCRFCHEVNSTETVVGPGLKGILKTDRLPFSKRPSTPENIIRQLKEPVNRMPAFGYLSEEENSDIIAYLNTL